MLTDGEYVKIHFSANEESRMKADNVLQMFLADGEHDEHDLSLSDEFSIIEFVYKHDGVYYLLIDNINNEYILVNDDERLLLQFIDNIMQAIEDQVSQFFFKGTDYEKKDDLEFVSDNVQLLINSQGLKISIPAFVSVSIDVSFLWKYILEFVESNFELKFEIYKDQQ